MRRILMNSRPPAKNMINLMEQDHLDAQKKLLRDIQHICVAFLQHRIDRSSNLKDAREQTVTNTRCIGAVEVVLFQD